MKTRSEALFESFLAVHGLPFEAVEPVANARRPDYRVSVGNGEVMFEVKELAESPSFAFASNPGEFRVYSSTVGQHLRRLIGRSKGQIQYGAKMGIPSVLVVYNNLDPLQMIGTERHDFEAAMYGDLTVSINTRTRKSGGLYHGGKKSFTENMNTSFAAIGHLCDRGADATMTLYENYFAAPGLPYSDLPACFNIVRTVMEGDYSASS